MSDKRVVFDFSITFSNGGGVQGQDFRLDIDGDGIDDNALATSIVSDLNLLMVGNVDILNKRIITEAHKRSVAGRSGSGAFVDLSHPIRDGMITYPGLPAPTIRTHLDREASRAVYESGTQFHIGGVDMVGNTGTYLDAPFHRYADGRDIAGLPLDRLMGLPGVVVHTGDRIIDGDTFDDVETWGRAVLICTGWDRRFGHDDYLGEHPHLTERAAQRLADGGAVLVGIDSSNIDSTTGGTRPAHSVLLDHDIAIVEHLTRLDQLGKDAFEFFALPAPVVGIGTFPIRAAARLGERHPTPG